MTKNLAIISFIITYMLLITLPSAAGVEQQVFINGQNLTNKLDPLLQDGQVMVNSRALAGQLGVKIKWFSAIKTLVLKGEKTEIKLMLDNPYIQINNQTFKSDVGLILNEGHSYVPLIEIAEALGYLVRKQDNNYYIFKPESVVKEISWEKKGQQLKLVMDKLAPYRIRKTDDPKMLILELDKATLAEDFADGLSNKNFYLKINKAENMARLQLVIISKYPIPFYRERGLEEDGDNLLINFLPQIKSIDWQEGQLIINANGEMNKPDLTLLNDPRRLVIDIPGMMLNKFDTNLPENEYIKDIRVSQFTYDPVTLRIVVELREGKHLYQKQEDNPERLVFMPSQITRVEGLECDDNTIRFITDNKVNPDIFPLQGPDRLVINLLNTVRGDDIPDTLEYDGDVVQRIRTARFNEETVRIVADLNRYTGYKWQQEQLPGGRYQHTIILENSIAGVNLEDSDLKTEININFSGRVEYEVKKFAYPDRLVVDVHDLTNNLTPEDLPEPVGLISEIRVNQFSSQPRIVRFVFDLKEYHDYMLYSSNPDNSINIALNKASAVSSKDVIVIDPGHGGFDPGAIGPSDLMEKDINLAIARRVTDLLRQENLQVLMSRNDDTFVSLKDRVQLANKADARIFVSIHNNSSSEEYSEGTETFLAPGKAGSSSMLANLLQSELVRSIKRVDRGVKKENLYVVKYTRMPAVLVEVAFISNPHEESLLDNDLFLDKAAAAISRGIKNYLNKIERGDEGGNE